MVYVRIRRATMFRSSDVDLFIYGLSEKEATEKVRQIYQVVKRANKKVTRHSSIALTYNRGPTTVSSKLGVTSPTRHTVMK